MSSSSTLNPVTQILTKLINHYLSHFFSNTSTHKFSTSILNASNSLELKHLKFRKYVMEDVLREIGVLNALLLCSGRDSDDAIHSKASSTNVAFQIKSGFIDNLHIHIPWQLQKKSIKVTVKGVCILLAPTSDMDLRDTTAHQNRALQWKQLRLDRWEERWLRGLDSLSSSKKGKHKRTSSFTSFLKGSKKRKSSLSSNPSLDSFADQLSDSAESTESSSTDQQPPRDSKEPASKTSPLEGGFFDRLLETILNNIQLEIEDVHIRYEDDRDEANPFVVGACVKQLLINSTDENWIPQFTREVHDVTFKLVSCRDFSVYLNHPLLHTNLHNQSTHTNEIQSALNQTFLSRRRPKRKLPPAPAHTGKKTSSQTSSSTPSLLEQEEQFDAQFISLMKDAMSSTNNQNIIAPVAAHLKLKMQKLSKSIVNMKKPQFDAQVDFRQVSTALSDLQYRTLMELVDYITNFATYAPYRRFKPMGSVKKHPREWWKFALKCIREDNSRKHIYWSQLKQFNKDRHRYIYLFKKKQDVSWLPKMTEEERDEFTAIETRTSLHNLTLFRKLAHAEIGEEQRQHTEWRKQQIKPKNLFSNKNTFFKKLLVLTPDPGTIQIDEETKLELYKSIGFSDDDDEESALRNQMDSDSNYVRMRLHLNLQESDMIFCESGATSLLTNTSAPQKDIVRAMFGGLSVTTEFMSKSFKTQVTATKFELVDCQSKHEIYRYAIRRRDLQSESALLSMSLIKNPQYSSDISADRASPNSSFVDYYVGLSLDHVNIILNVQFVQRLFSFLNVDHVNYQKLEKFARENIEKVTSRARDEIRKALESKVALDLDIRIKSPIVMLPVDCTSPDSQMLLLDLGAFSTKSELNKAREKLMLRDQALAEAEENSNDKNVDELPEDMDAMQFLQEDDVKDRFFLIFDAIRVLVPQQSAQQVLALSHQTSKNVFLEAFSKSEHLIDEVSFQVTITQSLLPEKERFPQLQISSDVPRIDLSISPEKSKVLLLLMDKFSDFVENPTGASDSDLRLRGDMMVNGPLSNGKWVKARVEVRSTRKIFVYDFGTDKLLGTIKLSKDTYVKPSKSKQNIFRVDLPQESEVISFFFACTSPDKRTEWITNLQQLIFSFNTNFYIGDLATMVMKDLKSTVEKNQGMGLVVPSSQKQTLLAINFSLGHFCAHVENAQREPLLNVDFSSLSLEMIHNSAETTVNATLKSVCALDLITDQTGNQSATNYIIKSTDDDAVVDVFLVYARESSSYFSKKAAIKVSTKFHGVHIYLEPSLLTHSIQFLYDILEVLDLIDLQKNVYQEFKRKIISSGRFENILQVDFQAGSVDLQVLNKGQEICLLSVPGCEASVAINTKRLILSGELQNLMAIDQATPNTIHKTILGLTDQKTDSMISFQFTQDLQAPHNLSHYSKSLHAKLQHIHYVHVQRFVTVLRDYSLEQLQHAVKRQKKRSLSLSSKQSPYSPAASGLISNEKIDDIRRLKSLMLVDLNIELVNPTVSVPVRFDRKTHLLANLGHISIRNKLIGTSSKPSLKTADEEDAPNLTYLALLEEYTVHPTNMKLEVISEELGCQHIVENVDMDVKIRKVVLNSSNLPSVSVSVILSKLAFDLSHHQFQTMFDIVNQNIRDGLEDMEKEQLFYKTIGKLSQRITQKLLSESSLSTTETINIEESQPAEEISPSARSSPQSVRFTQAHVTFSIPELTVTLHKGDSLQDPIVTLAIQDIATEYALQSDMSATGSVILRSVEGFDARLNTTNAFRRVFDSQTSSEAHSEDDFEIHSPRTCMKIQYEKTVENQHLCTLELSDPRIVFVPAIAKEFAQYITKTEYIQSIDTSPEQDILSTTASALPERQRGPNFNIRADFGHPEIVFPENCDDRHCRLLVLSFSAEGSFEKVGLEEKGMYELRELCAYVKFNDLNLPDSLSASLIKPMTIEAQLSTNHVEGRPTERIIRSQIVKGGSTRISYQDIKMIVDIMSQFNMTKKSNVEALDDTLEEGMLLKEWIAQNLRNSPLLLKLASHAHVSWIFTSKQALQVLIVDDIKGYDVPLLNLTLSKVRATGTLEQQLFEETCSEESTVLPPKSSLVALAEMHLLFDLRYFNFSIAEWEPVIEETEHPIHIRYHHKASDMPPYNSVDHVSVVCRDTVDVNVTHSMIETMLKTWRLWLAGLQSPRSMISLKFEPFTIRNMSGLNVKFFFPHVEDISQARSVSEVELRFSIPNINSGEQKDTLIALVVESTLKHIYVNKVANIFVKYDTTQSSQDSQKVNPTTDHAALGASDHLSTGLLSRNFCSVTVALEEARKVITIHSGVCVQNRTQLPWDVAVTLKKVKKDFCQEDLSKSMHIFGSILPGEKCFIPSQYLDAKYHLCVRPGISIQTFGTYTWNRPQESCGIQELFSRGNRKLLVACHPTSRTSRDKDSSSRLIGADVKEYFYCVLDVNARMEHNILLSANISLLPPLCIENLLASSLKLQLYTKKNEKSQLVYSTNIMAGEKEFIHTVSMKHNLWMRSTIIGDWTSKKAGLIYDSTNQYASVISSFTNTYNPNRKELLIKVDYNADRDMAFQQVCLYCPYWIVNHTKKNIQIRVDEEDIAGHLSAFEPLMFNYSSPNVLFSNKINLRVGNMFDSPNFSIDTPGTYGNIRVSNGSVSYELGVDVELAPGKFHRTIVVTLTPRYMLVNRTSTAMFFREHGTDHQIRVESNSSAPFYNISSRSQSDFPLICARSAHSLWSSPMRIDSNRDFAPLLWSSDTRTAQYASLQVYQEKSIVFALFEFMEHAPYLIENRSKFVLNVAQKGTSKWTIVEKGDPVPFTWIDQNGSHVLIIRCSSRHSSVTMNLDDVKAEAKLRIDNETAHIRLLTNGQTRVVTIDEQPTAPVLSMTREDFTMHPSADNPERTLFDISFHIAGLGVSVIDQKPQELLYAFVEGIHTSITMTNARQYLDLQAKRIQINNQLPDSLLPVAFINSKKLGDDDVFLRMSLVRAYKEKSYFSFPFFSFLMEEADVSLDLNFMNKVSNFFLALDPRTVSLDDSDKSRCQHDRSSRSALDESEHVTTDSGESDSGEKDLMDHLNWIREPVTELENSKKTYFQLFQIHPLKFNLTLLFNQREEAVLTKRSAFVSLFEAIGAQFNVNIDDSPLRFNALQLQHPFMTTKSLAERITKHYQQHTVTEIYKAIGSFDFLGNPIGLFHDFDTGVYDLFYEPLEALRRNPSEFTQGLARGSVSFVKHSFHGTFNTASKMTASLGNGLSYLTMDSEYINSRQKHHRKENPRHVGEGLLSGFQSLGSGFFEGFTGFVTKPLVGASEDGITGFFTGVGKGLVGVPVKPVTALLDFATQTTKGIRNTTTFFDKEVVERTRFPRVLGVDGRLIAYDAMIAQTQHVLHQANDGKYVDDHYVAHAVLRDLRSVVILSDRHMIFVVLPANHVEWEVDILEIGELKVVKHAQQQGAFAFVVLLNELGRIKNQGGWFSSGITEYRTGAVRRETGDTAQLERLIGKFKWFKGVSETHDLEG